MESDAVWKRSKSSGRIELLEASLLLVAMPGAPSSVLVPSSFKDVFLHNLDKEPLLLFQNSRPWMPSMLGMFLVTCGRLNVIT